MEQNGMEWNRMEWNGFSRERNRMEWNGMEQNLKILFGCYKIKVWNGMESKQHRLEVILKGME